MNCQVDTPLRSLECPQYPKAIDWCIYTYGHNELNFIQDSLNTYYVQSIMVDDTKKAKMSKKLSLPLKD